jgi:hypothetical protein
MPQGELSLEELIRIAVDAGVARVNTSLPGRIESYDAESQTANVTPMLKRPVYTANGEPTYEQLPVIRSVKVLHPGGEDWALHIPLKAGDTVELRVMQWDPTGWQTTGQVSEPRDLRTHHLAHVVAVPGYRLDSKPIPGASADFPTWQHKDGFKVTLKSNALEVGGSSDAAARASRVEAELDSIQNAFSTFVPGSGGASFPNPYVRVSGVGSTKLKTGD